MAYRRIFASPHVLALAVSSVVARLPVGMTGLAFVIYVQHRTGSFGAAGLVAGTFIAPTITTRTQIAKEAMPPGTGTEVFTWLSLSIMIGASASASSALAGPVVESGGWRAGVPLAAALPALGLPLLLARRHLLPAPGSAVSTL